MNSVEPLPSAPLPEDCRFVGIARTAMLIGPEAETKYVLASLSSKFRLPVVAVSVSSGFVLPPPQEVGTLIVHDIARLIERDQWQMCEWLDHASTELRVICTSPSSLAHDLATDRFLWSLYYRLNMVYVDLTAPQDRMNA